MQAICMKPGLLIYKQIQLAPSLAWASAAQRDEAEEL